MKKINGNGKKVYDFNISYSAVGLFNSCQRNFYYSYIAKLPGAESITAYGDAGNVVHTTLENAYFSPLQEVKDLFEELWTEKKLDTTNKGFYNRMLKKEAFWNAVINGISKKYKITQFEEKLEFQDDHLVKGFLDVVAKPQGIHPHEQAIIDKNPEIYMDIMCVDWKTNSAMDEGHVGQMEFYAYLWYRKYGKLPKKFVWEYIKIGKKLEHVLDMSHVYKVRDYIKKFVNDVYSKKKFDEWIPSKDGADSNCEEGACKFCGHKDRCRNEMSSKKTEEHFKIVIKNGKFKLNNPTSTVFDKVMTKYFSYEIANKDFVIRALRAKGRDWDGIVHMKKYGAYPIGLLEKFKYYISQYADAMNKHVTIEVDDSRKVFEPTVEHSNKLIGLKPRWYQNDAVDQMFRQKMGVIAVPTAGGKTVIAAEFYRKKPTKTLFVVDRKILLTQTVKEFEETLDMKGKVGTIEAGNINVISNLTVATIQTIHSRVKKKDKDMLNYLKDVEVIFSDEAHIAKADQYTSLFSSAHNSRFRFGLTGTPAEDAQNFLELNKNMGYVIYKIPVQQLIEEGTLMKPEIKFIKYDHGFLMEGDFNDMHEQLIENEERNQMIVDVCDREKGKVIMILVHRIAHGDKLEEMLKAKGHETFFIRGAVPNQLREKILDEARDGHTRILLGTSSIVSKGLNLKSLQVVINATGNATSIMTIQALGRVLRTKEGKESAHFYDMYDKMDYFFEHTMQRMQAFEKDGHEVEVVEAKFQWK